MPDRTPALLALEDGRTFRGRSWAADGEVCGEVVFNTSMTGYQEVLTDPSYTGQIVCMTYPLIGNYGVNDEDRESCRLRVRGAMMGVLSTADLDAASLVHKARTCPNIVGRDLVKEVVPAEPFHWTEGFTSELVTYLPPRPETHRVVALDYGM